MTTIDRQAREKVVALFHRAYTTCPAYHHFVDSQKVNAKTIQSPRDVEKIPIMDKDNYLKRYPLEEKIIDNKTLDDFYMITASSGSTGQPTFWPRDYVIDEKLEAKKEELYQQHYQISSKKTLIIISFALGMWTAGMLTAKLTWAAAKNNKLSVISTGMNRENILKSIQSFHGFYDQIILVGYPPFLINFMQYCEEQGYDLPLEKIKILYTAESLSQKARIFLASKLSITPSFKSVVGFYASSEAGIIAAETPSLAALAEQTLQNTEFNHQLFNSPVPATLFEYNPLAKYIEEHNGELLITSDQPVPLIRYNIHDRGAICTKKKLKQLLTKFSIDSSNLELPEWSVYIHGRSNSVVMTANIYIEDIKHCLEHSQFADRLTGHFQFGIIETEDLKKQLKVVVWLKNGAELNNQDQEIFINEFKENLFSVNADLQALKNDQEYLSSIAPFDISFMADSDYDVSGIKLKYFL